LLGIDDPKGQHRKRLVTFVEIDRCVTDAITVVTGCRLGKRALKFRDFGKVAATFCDLETGQAVRVVALDSSRHLAECMYPEIEDRNELQMRAYREMSASDLFRVEWVKVDIPAEDLPGFKAPRVACAGCGETVNFRREVVRGGRTLCRACAGERYYEPLPDLGPTPAR
jgi:formylmethanofuran dehydrogenase subunit E